MNFVGAATVQGEVRIHNYVDALEVSLLAMYDSLAPPGRERCESTGVLGITGGSELVC